MRRGVGLEVLEAEVVDALAGKVSEYKLGALDHGVPKSAEVGDRNGVIRVDGFAGQKSGGQVEADRDAVPFRVVGDGGCRGRRRVFGKLRGYLR